MRRGYGARRVRATRQVARGRRRRRRRRARGGGGFGARGDYPSARRVRDLAFVRRARARSGCVRGAAPRCAGDGRGDRRAGVGVPRRGFSRRDVRGDERVGGRFPVATRVRRVNDVFRRRRSRRPRFGNLVGRVRGRAGSRRARFQPRASRGARVSSLAPKDGLRDARLGGERVAERRHRANGGAARCRRRVDESVVLPCPSRRRRRRRARGSRVRVRFAKNVV